MAKRTPAADKAAAAKAAKDKAAKEKSAAAAKAAKEKPPAKAAKGTVRVRLLVGRTGVGHAGDEVEYPAADAKRHSQEPFCSVEILD